VGTSENEKLKGENNGPQQYSSIDEFEVLDGRGLKIPWDPGEYQIKGDLNAEVLSAMSATLEFSQGRQFDLTAKEERVIANDRNWMRRQAEYGNERYLSTESIPAMVAMTQRIAGDFPTTRRPMKRQLTKAPIQEVDAWVESSKITVGSIADTAERREYAKRILFTWKDCFITKLSELRATDLIEHTIVIQGDPTPPKTRLGKYTPLEIAFADKMFPSMIEAGILSPGISEWGARTQFVPKKPGTTDLRIVHNFKPGINKHTIKPAYPMHNLDVVVTTVVKAKFSAFFGADAANGYWAVPIAEADKFKSAIIFNHRQLFYNRMAQGLTGAPHTYCAFTDMTFGFLPSTQSTAAMSSMIGDNGETAFSPFVDDHNGAAVDFDSMAKLLHEQYFPRVAWAPIFLTGRKSSFFMPDLSFIGFTGDVRGLRPSIRHRERVLQWPRPESQQDVEAFCYLLPFLRKYIPGRAELTLIMKSAYREEQRVTLESGYLSKRKRWVDVDTFTWGEDQNAAFELAKTYIYNNVTSGGDPDLAYHLSTDASLEAAGGTLFQILGSSPDHLATDKDMDDITIICFMSFGFQEREQRYPITEREFLAALKCVEEVKWIISGSKYQTHLYTDHKALVSILNMSETKATPRIVGWQDKMNEFDIQAHHRAGKSTIMGIADGLSRMPSRYRQSCYAKLGERAHGLQANVATGGQNDFEAAQSSAEVSPSRRKVLPTDSTFEDCSPQTNLGRVGALSERAFQRPVALNATTERSETGVGVYVDAYAGMEEDSTVEEEGEEGFPDISAEVDAETRRIREEIMEEDELGRSATEYEGQFEKWTSSKEYGDIARYLLKGEAGLDNLDRNRSRAVRNQAKKFQLRSFALVRKEYDGQWARCVLKQDVVARLKYYHEHLGHFADAITMQRLKGQWWWPTRAEDVQNWCASCKSCQRNSHKRTSVNPRLRQEFRPMSVIAMDFIGPITPRCKVTGFHYILVAVDYFSRFCWLLGCVSPSSEVAVRMLRDVIMPAFGLPEATYSDQATSFMSHEYHNYCKTEKIRMMWTPVYYAQSNGLPERMVQMVVSILRKMCVDYRGILDRWGPSLPKIMLSLNTRFIKLYGFVPAEIMLGFLPAATNLELSTEWAQDAIDFDGSPVSLETMSTVIELREQRREEAVMAIADSNDVKERKYTDTPWTPPKAGDLVLEKIGKYNTSKNEKLNSRYTEPQLLVRVARNGVMGYIQRIHGDIGEDPEGEEEKVRYDPSIMVRLVHLNTLKVYCRRRPLAAFTANRVDSQNPLVFATVPPEYISQAATTEYQNWMHGMRCIFLDIKRHPTRDVMR